MKVIAALAVTLALFATSSADEDKKEKILNFYKCVACAEDHAVREEYMKCAELKPEKCKKIAEDCKATLMPEATTMDERLDTLCKDKDEINEKLFDCIMNDERKKDLDEEEKTQLKEFVQCTKKVQKKFCDH